MSLSIVHATLVSVLPIPQNANDCFTSSMDIYEIRRQNLIFLMRGQTKVAYATFIGTEAAYLSQILSPKMRGEVGASLARRIEKKHGLKRGWMDVEHQQELSAQARSVAEAVDSQGYSHDAQEQLANYLMNQIVQFRAFRMQSPAPNETGTETSSFVSSPTGRKPPQ